VLDDFDGWFHGGGDTVYIDGEGESSLIHGIGGEDFFGAAWGIAPFAAEYTGCTLKKDNLLSMYRFYQVPLRFARSIRFDFGTMANDLCSTAYWYQEEPHRHNTRLLPSEQRAFEAAVPRKDTDDPNYAPFPQEWLVAGPFDNRSRNFDETHAPETVIDLEMEVDSGPIHNYWRKDYPSVPIRWERYKSLHGFVDFTNLYRPKEMRGSILIPGDVVGYAVCKVSIPEALHAVLNLSYDDPIKIWINRKTVFRGEGQQGLATVKVPVQLDAGKNNVLVKCANRENFNWWWWGFKAFFTEIGGAVLPNSGNIE
jgi:hypothetical protein